MYTIDVVGSCICRDIFNSSFVNNYSEKFQLKTYLPRMSIPNIISQSENFTINELKEKSDNTWQFECLLKMCEKNCFDPIKNNQSDLLLLDFYSDSRYGMYLTEDNNYTSANGSLIKRMYESKKLMLMNYKNDVEFYFELWKKIFDYFIRKLKEIIPDTKIVLNGIKGVNVIKKEDGTIQKNNISDEDCKAINELWDRMNDYAMSKYNLDIITFSDEYFLNPDYIYGGANNETVHFDMKYYRDAFDKLVDYADHNVDKDRVCIKPIFNLLKNNDFRDDLKFWDFRNGFFTTFEKYDRKWIKPVKKYSESKSNFIWIWSNPIEINSDGNEEYTLSFDFVFGDQESCATSSLFGIRTFDKAIFESIKEVRQVFTVSNDNQLYPESEKIYHVNYSFKPKGKYIRIAPHIEGDHINISFSNICLVNGNNEIYIPWKNQACDTLSI